MVLCVRGVGRRLSMVPGIFRALRHRIGPDARKVKIHGRVFLFSLCGSAVVDREASQDIEQCPKCKRHP